MTKIKRLKDFGSDLVYFSFMILFIYEAFMIIFSLMREINTLEWYWVVVGIVSYFGIIIFSLLFYEWFFKIEEK